MKKNNQAPTVHGSSLRFGDSGLQVSFQRTLRIPDDGKKYPLPPGLGRFPIRRVDDYAERVPEEWLERGGVFIPMYQREAMWIHFSGPSHKPRAVKIGIGKVCAISGANWSSTLRRRKGKQDYVVTPPQPWLDGIATGRGTIRQFVAMPLGMGYTVEGQVTGNEVHGGIQLKVFEPKPGRFPDLPPRRYRMRAAPGAPMPAACAPPAQAMGIAAGGKMTQKIYPDPHGIGTWDPENTRRVFVHVVNSQVWREITGEEAPPTPVSAREYARAGLPWYSLYDEGMPAQKGSSILAKVKSVAKIDKKYSTKPLQDDSSVSNANVVKLADPTAVRDGDW